MLSPHRVAHFRRPSRRGFTLIEIMIVLAIIVLIAAIATPSFIRSRQRALASAVLQEMKLIQAAQEQWAVETNQSGDADVTFEPLKKYFHTGSRLAAAESATDLIGNPITLGKVNGHATLSTETIENFRDMFDLESDPDAENRYWGVHKPDL